MSNQNDFTMEELSRLAPEAVFGAPFDFVDEVVNYPFTLPLDHPERIRLSEVAADLASAEDAAAEQAAERVADNVFGGFNDRFVPDDPNDIEF